MSGNSSFDSRYGMFVLCRHETSCYTIPESHRKTPIRPEMKQICSEQHKKEKWYHSDLHVRFLVSWLHWNCDFEKLICGRSNWRCSWLCRQKVLNRWPEGSTIKRRDLCSNENKQTEAPASGLWQNLSIKHFSCFEFIFFSSRGATHSYICFDKANSTGTPTINSLDSFISFMWRNKDSSHCFPVLYLSFLFYLTSSLSNFYFVLYKFFIQQNI